MSFVDSFVDFSAARSRPSGTLAVLSVVTLIVAAAPAGAQSASPFAGLAGVWSGTGSIALSNGSRERIRCRATYAVGDNGNGLQQTLRCASDSYKFELSSDVHNRGGRITGTWAESTRGVSGELQGRAAGGQFQVTVSSAAFTAALSLSTKGNSQSVHITSQGTEFSGVTIALSRV